MPRPRTYPELAFHCPELPEMDACQRTAWCARCERKVHNLSAITAQQQERLLSAEPDACISYRRVIPVVVAVAMSVGIPSNASAQDSEDEDATELTTVTITGGLARRVSPLFVESQLPEPGIEQPEPEQP